MFRIKDAAQVFMGKASEIKGETVKHLYEELGMELDE